MEKTVQMVVVQLVYLVYITSAPIHAMQKTVQMLYAWIGVEVIWNEVDAHVNRENRKHNKNSKCLYT